MTPVMVSGMYLLKPAHGEPVEPSLTQLPVLLDLPIKPHCEEMDTPYDPAPDPVPAGTLSSRG